MRDLSRDQLIAELRQLRPQFEREGVVGMVLFGSRARGDNRPDSDVDIVVDIEEGRRFGLEAVGVYHIIEDNLGLATSVVPRSGLADDPEFGRRVANDEIVVF